MEGKHTQKHISYIFTPCLINGSTSPSCFSVSIVLGCRPSARPVEVLSFLSSTITGLIPYLARFELLWESRSEKIAFHFGPFRVSSQLIYALERTYANINPAGPAPTTTTFSILELLFTTSSWPLVEISFCTLGDIVGEDSCDLVRFITTYEV